MNKQMIIFFLAVVGATGISWYYCLFTPYNYFSAKKDIANDKVAFISFGLPALERFNILSYSIREKYGIKYKNIGCVVTEDEIRGIHFYNTVIEEYLTKRNGERWKKKYTKELADSSK